MERTLTVVAAVAFAAALVFFAAAAVLFVKLEVSSAIRYLRGRRGAASVGARATGGDAARFPQGRVPAPPNMREACGEVICGLRGRRGEVAKKGRRRLPHGLQAVVSLALAASLLAGSFAAAAAAVETAGGAGGPSAQSHASKGVAWMDLGAPITIDFDAYSLAEVDAGSLVISRETLDETVLGLDAVAEAANLSYTPGGANAASRAIDEALAELGRSLAPSEGAAIIDGSFGLASGETGEPVSFALEDCRYEVTATSGEPALVMAPRADGAVEVTASGRASGPLTLEFRVIEVRFSYAFDYSYREGPSSASGSAGGGTTTVVRSYSAGDAASWEAIPFDSLVASYTTAPVVAKDYWADLEINESAILEGSVTYGDGARAFVVEAGVNKPGLTGRLDASGAASYRVASTLASNGADYSLVATPRAASGTAPETVVVTWLYPNGSPAGKSTAVTLPRVERKVIDLGELAGLEGLPYRMPREQEAVMLNALNAYVRSQATAGDRKAMISCFSSVTIDDEAAYLAAVTTGLSLSGGASRAVSSSLPSCAENYRIVGEPTASVVAAVQSDWASDAEARERLAITGSGLAGRGSGPVVITAATRDDLWLNGGASPALSFGGDGVVSIAGSSPRLGAGQFDGAGRTAALALASGDGKNIGNEYVFIKNSSGVVRIISGVRFCYDATAPELASFRIAARGAQGYYGNNGENWAAEGFDASFVPADAVSGILEGSLRASCGDVSAAISAGSGAGEYGFAIGGNQKVALGSVEVSVTDRAGNCKTFTGEDSQLPARLASLVAIEDAPTIAVSWSGGDARNGSYYAASRTLSVAVTMPFFEELQRYPEALDDAGVVLIRRDGQVWRSIAVTDAGWERVGANTWQISVTLDEDGAYELEDVRVCDFTHRSASVQGSSFTIDTTAPTVQVSFDNDDVHNGRYYNAARTATVSITERNFSAESVELTPSMADVNGETCIAPAISGWSVSGDVHSATVYFPGPGAYGLSVSGQDLAENELEPYSCEGFIIDTTAPEIRVDGVADFSAYAGDAAPSVAIHDTNLDQSSSDVFVTKVSCPFSPDDENPYAEGPAAAGATATDMTVDHTSPEAVRAYDGVYTLEVEAVDLAGNAASQALTWSVNRFGSTYLLSDATRAMLGRYLRSEELADVTLLEVNPSGLNEAELAVELARDAQATTLVEGEGYTVRMSAESGWPAYAYAVGKDNYKGSDGVYRVLFHSHDAAGNVSENTMAGKNAEVEGAAAEVCFAVDDTRPIASFVGLASDGRYEEAGHAAKVTFEDNLRLDHAVVKVNGEVCAELDAAQLDASATHEIRLAESAEPQTVSAIVYDAAGNASDELVASNVLVTTNPLTLWLANTPLFAGTIMLAASALGGIVCAVRRLVGPRRSGRRAGRERPSSPWAERRRREVE